MHPVLKKTLLAAAMLVCALTGRANPPAWWGVGDPPVIVPGAVSNNHGPANIGQAKHMAKSALDALATVLPQVALQVEADLVGAGKPVPNWNPPADQAARDRNHAPLLTGQLKAIAHPFYVRLHAAAPVWLAEQRAANGTESGGIFPWTDVPSDDNHHGMANLGQLKAVFALHFTRDTDGDTLPDLLEHVLGTNPAQAMTFPGIPDAWVAANFPSAQNFDPYGDPDGDGLTNQQEQELGLDPNSADVIGPVNFGFDAEITDSPTMSFRPDNPSDLYEDMSIPGWEPDIGSHIEIWDEDDGNPYAELQSHLGSHGVKQKFDMIPGTRLNFILRYKGRYYWETYENAFDLKVEGASAMLVNGSPATATGSIFSHAFMEDDDGENYTDWHYAAVSITAESGDSGLKEITLTLAPQTTTTYGDEEITYGGFVDFMRVTIEDNTFGTGVDNVSIRSKVDDIGHQDKLWIMAPSGNDPNGNPCSNEMKFKSLEKALEELEITYPQIAQPPATPTPSTVKLGSPPNEPQPDGSCAWHGESPTTTETPAVAWKIGAPGQTKTDVNLPIAVKTMKRRTVKVAVHYVTGKITRNSGNIELRPPTSQPTAAQIKQKLYDVYSRQINTWFEDLECKSHEIEWDIGEDSDWGTIEHPVSGTVLIPGNRELNFGGHLTSSPADHVSVEEQELLDVRNADTDIDVFVVGGCNDILTYAGDQGQVMLISERFRGGVTKRERRAIYIAGERYGSTINPIPEDLLLQEIAHEIGHIFLGYGHPDDGTGPAPLKGTNHLERLMFSHGLIKKDKGFLNRNLLVKKEWDEAENWLTARELARSQGGNQ